MLKISLLLLCLLLPLPALAADDDCGNAIATPEINACMEKDFERADAALNATYVQVLASLKQQGTEYPEMLEARTTLIAAQRLWVAFRKSDCDAVFALNSGGSIRVAAFLGCMTNHAEQRTKALSETYL